MCKCVRDADRLDSMSPSTMKNDVDDISITKDVIHLKSTRYKTRLLVSETQVRPSLPPPCVISDRFVRR